MANEKVFQSRIQLKHDIEENWLKAINFVPKEGEIIIYDSDSNNPTPRFKIGDGVAVIGSLPFVAAQADWNSTDESNSGYIKNKPNYDKIVTDLEELSTNVAYINKEDNENIESPDIAASSVIIDSALSRTSTNPVQNKTITEKFAEISETINNLPQADWNQNDTSAIDYIKNRPFYKEPTNLGFTYHTIDPKYLPIIDVAHGGTGRSTIADTEYTTAKYRASALVTTETDPTDNGVIYWTYE